MLNIRKHINWTVILSIAAAFALVSVGLLASVLISSRTIAPEESVPPTEPETYAIMDGFDTLISREWTKSYDAASNVRKIFWIGEDEEIAPKPDAGCFGESSDPSSLQWLLDEAAELLNGQELVFSTDIEIYPHSSVSYYLDESIFVISWQQLLDDYVYTFSEVKISHPSQFRRHLAGNEYDSGYAHPVSRMGNMTNAVLASSADFYRGRNHGIIVYQGQVKRTNFSELVDTCFIDKEGNLILVPAGELMGMDAAQQFVDENQIDFSLAFGPILVKDGVRCEPKKYYLGEIYDGYPRAALCQKDDLHYLIVLANGKDNHWNSPNIHTFAKHIDALNCESAYTLDGGRTGTVAMQGRALNPLKSGERWISDIIYFATAIPSSDHVTGETTP